MKATAARVTLAALTLLFLALGLLQAARDAPTVDEATDLVASLHTVEDHDLRLNPEHGALFHAVSGVLPVLVADPLLSSGDAYREGRWFDHTDEVIAANDCAGTLDRVVFWFRVAPLVAGAATGWVLWALGRRVGGEVGGLLAGGAWLTTPYVLGISHLGSLDVAFALAATGLVLLLVRDAEAPSVARAVAVAVGLGAALAVRHSAVVLVPVVLVLVLVNRRGDRRAMARGALVAVVVPVAVVWALYRGLDPVPVDGPPAERFEAIIAAASANGPVERLVLAVPMPVEWRAGFGYLALTADQRPAYLLGDTYTGSRPWFFPVSALIKLPLTVTIAVAAGVLLLRRRVRSTLAVPVLSVGLVLAGFLVAQPLDLGVRLALPVIAITLVAVAGLAPRLSDRRWQAAVGVLAVTQLVALVASHPSSLAWTPPPFGDGYRYVSDSSIDFGQALRTVRDAHRRDPFVAVSLVTPRGLTAPAGTRSVAEATDEQLVGRIAVGATALLVTQADELSWLRAYCPVEVLDGAVLVYELDAPPDRTPASGMPEPPCDEGPSVRRR